MTTYLGLSGSLVEFPDPVQGEYIEELEKLGESRRTLDGSLLTHYPASAKRRFTVPYQGLTKTQKDNLITEAERADDLQFVTSEGGTYNVTVDRFIWHKGGGKAIYAAEIELRETS